MAQGRGVPVELRLFVEALAWAPAAARRGLLAEVDLTVRDLVHAIWPNGWRRNEDLPKLFRSIDRISAFSVLSGGRFRWRPLWYTCTGTCATKTASFHSEKWNSRSSWAA